MEVLKLSKDLLHAIGLFDRCTTRRTVVFLKYGLVTFFLVLVMTTCFLFVADNSDNFILAARALLPSFALLISCVTYWILIVNKDEIRDVLEAFGGLVNDSKYRNKTTKYVPLLSKSQRKGRLLLTLNRLRFEQRHWKRLVLSFKRLIS